MTQNNSSTRPNFFLLLELNPDARWNQATFEEALRKKRIEWSRQSASVGKKALVAKSYLQLLTEISRVMEDPTLRAKEADGARAERMSGQKEQQRERLEECEKLIAFLNAKDTIEQEELQKFIADFQDVLSSQEIRARITAKVVAARTSSDSTVQPLEPSMMKQIIGFLKTINMNTLYELLGYPETASADELNKAAERLNLDMVHQQQKSAEVEAKLQLAGLAKDVFKSEEMRKRYDYSMRLALLDPLLRKLGEMVARSPDKELQVGQVALFLEEAQKIGWNQTVAYARLKDYSRQQKWGVLPSITMNTAVQRVRCGNCHVLNDKQQNFCTNCQRALYIDCPNCNQRVLSDAIHCGNCGFSVGDRLWIETSLEQCQELLSKNNVREAQKILTRVEGVWRPQRPDALVRKIEECKALVQRVKQELKQKENHLAQLIDKRLLYEARHYLLSNTTDIPESEMQRQLIESGLSHAQEALRRARTVGISQDERREHCLQALQLCADFKEARALLQTLPPAPPDRLQARVRGDVVSLSWTPSSTRNAVYAVVRKAQSQPIALSDGEEIARVSGQMYDDARPPIGRPLYYAVFAVCEAVPSTQGALLTTSILLIHDVTQEGATVSNHRIDLSWRPPPHVYSVVVVRKEQTPPASLHDGIQIPVSDTTQSSVIDRNVQNERLYYYGIYCQFKDGNGQLISSQGKIVSAKPETPPSLISDLHISGTRTAQGHEITLRWQPPEKGVGVILKATKSLGLKEGSVVPETHLRTLGQLLEDQPDSVIDVWKTHGIAYYVPVVLFQRMAYVGAERRYVAVEDVQNLTRRVFNTCIHLTWTWPQNCQEVQITIVTASPASFPVDATVPSSLEHSGTASTVRLGLTEYNRAGGHYEVNGIVNHTYHIIVAALVKQGNELIAASGQSVSATLMNMLEISYYIKNPSMFRKKRTLHIHPLNSGYLPPIILVCKQQVLPFNKNDGEIIGSWGMQQVTASKELELELPLKAFPPDTLCKLFLEENIHYDFVKVNLPIETKLRIQ